MNRIVLFPNFFNFCYQASIDTNDENGQKEDFENKPNSNLVFHESFSQKVSMVGWGDSNPTVLILKGNDVERVLSEFKTLLCSLNKD